MTDAPRLKEGPCLVGGEFKATVARELNGDPFGAEKQAKAQNEASSSAVDVDPSRETVGAYQVVRAIQVKIVSDNAFKWRRRGIRLFAGYLLEGQAITFARRAHHTSIGNVSGDAGPEY